MATSPDTEKQSKLQQQQKYEYQHATNYQMENNKKEMTQNLNENAGCQQNQQLDPKNNKWNHTWEGKKACSIVS